MAAPKHRENIVAAAATLRRRQGFAATGVNDIVRESGAPKGSLYHYFPAGKAQIGAAAVTYAGGRVTRTLLDLFASCETAEEMVRAYAAMLAGWMAKSQFRDGCPISTTLLETTPAEPGIAEAGRTAFAAWNDIWAAKLIRGGVTPARAKRLAAFTLATLQGALLVARVEGRAGPLEDAAEELARTFRRAREEGVVNAP
jgi:TetR/AcrR family transcriptional regulator, lmrAB and yxaGH operons repressor